jgi:hypothetical protein
MNKTEQHVPFGLLFEETAPEPEELVTPIYDEGKDYSCIQVQGEWVPVVELTKHMGTQTATKSFRETTDTDPGDDRQRVASLDTQSITFVASESTDTDPEEDNKNDRRSRAFLSTQTVTSIKEEATDED